MAQMNLFPQPEKSELFCPECKTQTLVHPIVPVLLIPDRARLVCETCENTYLKASLEEKESEKIIPDQYGEVTFEIDILEGKVIVSGNIVEPSIAALKKIVDEKSYMTFAWSDKKNDCILVDVVTANMLLQIWDALKRKSDGKIATPAMRKFQHMLVTSPHLFSVLVDKSWKLMNGK